LIFSLVPQQKYPLFSWISCALGTKCARLQLHYSIPSSNSLHSIERGPVRGVSREIMTTGNYSLMLLSAGCTTHRLEVQFYVLCSGLSAANVHSSIFVLHLR